MIVTSIIYSKQTLPHSVLQGSAGAYLSCREVKAVSLQGHRKRNNPSHSTQNSRASHAFRLPKEAEEKLFRNWACDLLSERHQCLLLHQRVAPNHDISVLVPVPSILDLHLLGIRWTLVSPIESANVALQEEKKTERFNYPSFTWYCSSRTLDLCTWQKGC